MKKLITEKDLIELEKKGVKVVVIDKETLITPLALDRIRASKFSIVEQEIPQNIK
jgi:hypothetical protein